MSLLNYQNVLEPMMKFATELAEQGKVAVIPGSYFGAGGSGYLRISYATSMADIEEAIRRISQFVKED